MTDPRRKDKQIAQARRVIVADCYKRGLTIRQTCEQVMVKMGLEKLPSTKTVFNDRTELLKEWKEERITDVDDLIQLELQRIDDAIATLWESWEKSRVDYKAKFSKRKGEIVKAKANPSKEEKGQPSSAGNLNTTHLEQGEREEINFGDPRYITEIRNQLIERRKLLGLYAPEKKELSGANGTELFAGFDSFMAKCRDVVLDENE